MYMFDLIISREFRRQPFGNNGSFTLNFFLLVSSFYLLRKVTVESLFWIIEKLSNSTHFLNGPIPASFCLVRLFQMTQFK